MDVKVVGGTGRAAPLLEAVGGQIMPASAQWLLRAEAKDGNWLVTQIAMPRWGSPPRRGERE
jgi:hypothetical protein